ncbi:hypothetical protein AC579_6113 [Pseudocercospora musae]|uniref:Distal membrane-arm assembly complex protein 1-like domain-containing protein n=1 Tax=Pseudocercospora musae TaxID=113226 RepID=A0A139GT24_9PEZI|nr:hypothetical protein AC579_6113 [Pseudocercospora musae]
MSTDPTARSLPSDTSMSSALASQRNASGYDCTPCRLMGSATFVGLGAYTYYSGMKQLRQADIQQQILKSGSRFGLGAGELKLEYEKLPKRLRWMDGLPLLSFKNTKTHKRCKNNRPPSTTTAIRLMAAETFRIEQYVSSTNSAKTRDVLLRSRENDYRNVLKADVYFF